jgi:hypothetical protein
MKVFAASATNNGGDHYLFVSLSEDNIAEQIIELGRLEYGDKADNPDWDEQYGDEYLNYDHYLLDQYYITVEQDFDL